MPPTARERATLERVRDDLGLAPGLGDEATLAAAHQYNANKFARTTRLSRYS